MHCSPPPKSSPTSASLAQTSASLAETAQMSPSVPFSTCPLNVDPFYLFFILMVSSTISGPKTAIPVSELHLVQHSTALLRAWHLIPCRLCRATHKWASLALPSTSKYMSSPASHMPLLSVPFFFLCLHLILRG